MTDPVDALTGELRAARAELRRAWDSVPAVLRRRSAGGWSALQILDHLARTHGQVVRLVRGLLATDAASTLAPRGDGPPVETLLDGLRVPDRSRPVQAPEFALPRPDADPDAAWNRLDEGLDTLLEIAERVAPLEVSHLRAPHPILGALDVHQWLLFTAHHERRHAEQMRGLGRTLGS